MKRTQESRRSLSMKSIKTEGYARLETVASVLRSIEKSTRQVTTILEKNQEIQSSELWNSNLLHWLHLSIRASQRYFPKTRIPKLCKSYSDLFLFLIFWPLFSFTTSYFWVFVTFSIYLQFYLAHSLCPSLIAFVLFDFFFALSCVDDIESYHNFRLTFKSVVIVRSSWGRDLFVMITAEWFVSYFWVNGHTMMSGRWCCILDLHSLAAATALDFCFPALALKQAGSDQQWVEHHF